MLQTEKYSPEEIRKIQGACCHIFMTEQAMRSVVVAEQNGQRLHYPFLEQLTYEDVKQAYRTNVFTYHPDRHQDKDPEDIHFYTRHVKGVNRSYDYLSALFEAKKAAHSPEGEGRSRIIAVGGAKGGIGKSIFAANLGMMLNNMGFRTLMVDLDLGGSNLHVYLGHKRIPQVTLNDFLNRKVSFLNDAVAECGKKPMLIAGDSGELGAANISFQRKMRLIESIRRLKADYVILDLGGGTDFNTLDFFLASDLGIVLTTLDQSAYLEAYAFIKTALLRKLRRLFSTDSAFPARNNMVLKEIVTEGTSVPERDDPRTIHAMLEKVAKKDPVSLPLIADEILGFAPRLVINHSFDHAAARRVASTLRFVGNQRLSIDINHAGTISRHRMIEESTSYRHHPLVNRQCSDMFVSEMESIIRSLGLN